MPYLNDFNFSINAGKFYLNMARYTQKIVVAATPTSPLLPNLIHALQHRPDTEVTVLTRETSVSIIDTHSHNHEHANGHSHLISHIKTSFSDSNLKSTLEGKDAVICILTGSDLHLSGPLVDAAFSAGIKFFIPSEYGLDTSNSKIRELLPPYRTRYEVQQKLREGKMSWKAIYSGIVLEDAMKTDGVLGIDVMWASAVIFPGNDTSKIAVSTFTDIANRITEALGMEEIKEEYYTSSFRATIGDIVEVVEQELDRKVDQYEGSLEGAKKEAAERMKHGYFDGGVALMGRVAVWNPEVTAWAAWNDTDGTSQAGWKEEVKKAVRLVRGGKNWWRWLWLLSSVGFTDMSAYNGSEEWYYE